MKRWNVMLTAFLLALLCGCTRAPSVGQVPQDEPIAQVPNPVVDVDGPKAFDPLGFTIDAPAGAENVRYSIIADQLAQVNFTLAGREYTYHAASTEDDITGVYETFDMEELNVQADGTDWYAEVNVRTISGGQRGAVALFFYEPVQYSLYTGDTITAQELVTLAVGLAEKACPRPAMTPEGDPDALEENVDGDAADIQAMHPVLDSIVRLVGVEEGARWTGKEEAEQLWTALYLLGVNWCESAEGTRVEGAYLMVPKQLMAQWASAFGKGLGQLPEYPDNLSIMAYDAAEDAYQLELSDAGESETRIETCFLQDDGTYAVKVGLYLAEEERIGGMDFVLENNPHDSAGQSAAFPYTVRSATAETQG